MKKGTIYLALVSLIITISIVIIIKSATYPYQINIDKINRNEVVGELYCDFTNDGVTDQIKVFNNTLTKRVSFQIWQEPSHAVLEQHNFKYKIRLGDFNFSDWNGDGYNELIAFSYNDIGSYITVFDVKNEKMIHNERLFFKSNSCEGSNNWIPRAQTKLDYFNLNKSERKAVILIDGAFNYECRSVLVIDTESLKIESEYNSTASFYDLKVIKDESGKFKQLIVTSSAPSNDGGDFTYSDRFCWLFSFDKELNLISKPIKFGKFPSILSILDSINNTIYLIHSKTYKEDTGIDIYKYTTTYTEKVFSDSLIGIAQPIKITRSDGKIIYRYFGINKAIEFGLDFKKINEWTFGNNKFTKYCSSDGRIYKNDSKVYLLDNDFNIIATTNDKNILNTYGVLLDYSLDENKNTGEKTYIFYDSDNIYKLKAATNTINASIYYFAVPMYIVIFFLLNLSFYVSLRFLLDLKTKRNLIYSNINGMLLLDQKLRIKYINKVLMELLELNENYYRNSSYKIVLKKNKEFLEHVKNGISKNEFINENVSFYFQRNEFNGRLLITPFKIFEKFIVGYFIELINYTEPISLERIKAWSKTSQKLAHDIKTPLSTIHLNISVIEQRINRENIEGKEKYFDDIEDIKIELNRITNLTRNFLQLTNLNKPNKSIITVKELIERPLIRFENYLKKTIKLVLDIKNNQTNIFCDLNQFEQVFEVLIENAIESIGSRGNIKISTNENEHFVKIFITDDGEGIKKEDLEKLFEPYFTTKNEGSGLGLVIAKNIVEDHGGEITIKSVYGKGTTVKFTIPKWIINENKN